MSPQFRDLKLRYPSEGDEEMPQQLQGRSITYRISMGPQAGRKVLPLQTIPACEEEEYDTDQLGRIGRFSLHAGVAVNMQAAGTYCRGGPAGMPFAECYRKTRLEHARRRQGFARQLKSHGWSMDTAQGRGR